MGFAAACFALLIVAAGILLTSRSTTSRAARVSRTLEIQDHLNGIATSISDAESGVYGFLITRDPAFHQLYQSSIAPLDPQLLQLKSLISDSAQHVRLDSLRVLVTHLAGTFARTMAPVDRQGTEPIPSAMDLDNERTGMEGVRRAIARIQVEEQRLLQDRSTAFDVSVRRERIAIWLGIALSVATVVMGFLLTRSELSGRTRNEARFRAVVESAPSGMVMVDRTGKIVLVNRETERLFGYHRDELLGQRIELLVPVKLRDRHPGLRADFQADPQTRAMGAGRDLHGLRKDGTEIPVEIGLNPIKTDEGMFVLASVVDITERKRAEARFRAVVESAPSGMVMIDREGKITLVNRETERLFGYTRDELLGQPIERLVPERFRHMHPGFRAGFFADPQFRAMGAGRDLFGARKDGSDFRVEIGLNPIETDEGLFVLASIVDITERKRSEDELRRSNEELERFAYVASHDLQEPLRMVGSYVQLLAKRYKGRLDTDADEFIGFALDGALRMQGLIQDLLAFSRVGTKGSLPTPTESTAAFNRAVASLKLAIDESGAIITHDPLPMILADAGQLEHLFLNLIGNALKFRGSEPPRIHLSVIREDGRWRFGMADNGIGIAPEYFDRIFVIFQRLHGRAEYPGTGIGLAIARKIVERHGGRIWVESEPGHGTTFFFTIPATAQA